MRYLKTNTATIVTVGPFFDKTDGVTIETGLTITNERITFVVDANDGSAPTLVLDNVTGATSGTSNDLNYITNNDAGLMQLELAAANVNYLGRAMLTITDAANHVPVFHEFMILPAVVYDALVAGTDYLTVDAVQVEGADATDQIRDAVVDDATRIDASALNTASGTSIPAILADTGTDGVVVAAASKTGYTLTATTGLGNQTANITGNLSGSVGSVTGAVGSVASGGITAASIATNAIDADAIATDAVTELQSGLATAANLATLTGYVDTEVAAILAAVDTEVAAIKTKTDYLPSATAGAAGGLFIAGSNAATTVNITGNVTGNLSGSVGSVTGAVGSVTGAVGSVTGNVGGNVAGSVASVTNAVTVGTNNDKTGYALSSAGVQAIWDALTSALTTVGSVGKRIADNLDGTVSSRSSHSAADVWAAATRTLTSAADSAGVTTLLSRIVGTLAAGTHNAQSGDAYARLGAPAGASVSADVAAVKAQTAAIEADTQDLQTQVGTDGAGLTALPWNAAWDAEVQSEAADALAAYDPPTKAELDSAVAPLATAAALDAVDNYVDTEIAAIKAKTDNLPSDPADQSAVEAAITAATSTLATAANLATLAGYVDTEVAAIKAKTDNLPASPAAVGSAMTLTAAYDAAKTAATQASVDDLPTNAELATALAGADDAVLAAVAALNNLSSAQAQTAAAAALTAYDPPTNAEMEARTLVAANYATAAALDAVDNYVDTEVAVIKAVTDKLDTALVLDGAVYQLTANALELAPTGGSAPSAATIASAVRTELATELGRINVPIDSRLAPATAGRTLDVAATGEASANVTYWAGQATSHTDGTPDTNLKWINGVQLASTSSEGYLPAEIDAFSEGAIRTAIGLATANMDAQLAGLPTAADVQAAATAALEAYDPPTMAELTSAVAPLALEATAQAILEDTGTTLPTAIAAIEPGGGSYAGDGIGYYSDTIDDGTSPLDGVRVQLYTSPNRVGPAYEAYTNALGVFEMWPDPGTYYRWLDLAGYNFSQDVAVTVTEP